jgi:chemotaxis-related protein WspB
VRLGNDCYALDAASVVEILPMVNVRKILRPPPGIAGLLNYRGAFVPVLDLSQLALDRPALSQLSTRIILALFSGEDGSLRPLGLIAEHATETMRCEPSDFVSSGIINDDAPYLGPISMTPRGLVQRIELDRLVPATVRRSLFDQPVQSR